MNETTVNTHQPDHVLLARDSQRCVWMQAGLLTYQLCDREFECESCPLDAALRHQSTIDQSISKLLQHTRLYSRRHCWIMKTGNRVVVGIEPLFASRLLGITDVELPQQGERLKPNRVSVTIVAERERVPVFTPCAGRVASVNALLQQDVHQLTDSPLDRGWLFEYHTRSVTQPNEPMMNAAEAHRKYEEDEIEFRAALQGLVGPAGRSVGATLTDGGESSRQIFSAVEPAQYYHLLRLHFCKEAKTEP
jgi:glycine cleavage system H lipoate-binding protein